ncbi:GntR family transcriptional regulator [Marinimicrococcus flavescens]|uniref:GntR family transcriptional regulator n=1 Tax=Marinimicrococcus flavescens TaxID=3031815 RepID=A0AAP4D5S0_9PROT|nr:GntR family transcriptional regulator [Marinimicrococcus flavescens]
MTGHPTQPLAEVERENLASRVYQALRQALMAGHFKPNDRLRVRELAARMGTSETPVREALMKLVSERALELKAGHSIRVPHLSLARYMEIRGLRVMLECAAAEAALEHADEALLAELEAIQKDLLEARRSGDHARALALNHDFHSTLWRASGNDTLVELIENLWLRTGSIRSHLYPYATPFRQGPHGHEPVLAALRRGDRLALRAAIEADLIEGGAPLVRYLETMEKGQG